MFKTFYIFIFFSIALTNWDGAFTYKTSLQTKLGTFEAGEKNINIKYLVNDYTPPHAMPSLQLRQRELQCAPMHARLLWTRKGTHYVWKNIPAIA